MNRLSPELRAAEQEIDEEYRSNPLVKRKLTESLWYLLAAFDHELFQTVNTYRQHGRYRVEPNIDHHLFMIRWPVRWLRTSCPPGGEIPSQFNPSLLRAATELLDLASNYMSFYKAYTRASEGLLDLRIDGDKLIASGFNYTDSQYEAYNRLVKPIDSIVDTGPLKGLRKIDEELFETLEIRDDRFSYKSHPDTVALAIDTLAPTVTPRFSLPDSWQFVRYSMADFRKVFSAVYALAYLHYVARDLAVKAGCGNQGILNSLMITTLYGLVIRVERYTQLKKDLVKEVINDLVLGANNISVEQADPTLQPLVPISHDLFAIAPQLWIHNAAERNFVVLMNRLPAEKAIYLNLVTQKEKIMRERIVESIKSQSWRSWHGPVKGKLPDVDLALIDSGNRACLLIELKWFIDPAEPRELMEKTKEINKGISQVLALKQALNRGDVALFDSLGITPDYSIGVAVVSANWIGYSDAQHGDVPVIREHHLVNKLTTTSNLAEVLDWLSQRKYLPQEGIHYELVKSDSRVGTWTLEWYSLRALIDEDKFLPL